MREREKNNAMSQRVDSTVKQYPSVTLNFLLFDKSKVRTKRFRVINNRPFKVWGYQKEEETHINSS